MKPPPPLNISDILDNIIPLMTKEEIHTYRAVPKDMMHDATESAISICGMAPMDTDDPFYNIFPTLNCNPHIEGDFYTFRIMPEPIKLCCYYAG